MKVFNTISQDLVLRGKFAALEPLRAEHEEELVAAASDGELWNLNFTSVPSRQSAAAYISEAMQHKSQGVQFPFVVRDLKSDKIVGSTRYYDISQQHRNLAIGYTWYAKSVQRTAINTQCKLLLLTYAFEQLKTIGVAFHTDNLNIVSQAAIARLGAKHEGILRHHRVMPDGRIRDTWCYSILDHEWPAIKERLLTRLNGTS